MRIFLKLLLAAALLSSTAVPAADHAVIVQSAPAPAPNGESTLNLRRDQGSRCEAPATGECSSCAISCPVGSAAVCKAGKSVSRQDNGSCLREPVCRCE